MLYNTSMKKRYILHCDLNGFFASVECVFNPELKNIPMAVGGSRETRHGIILAKNELAKKCGVKTAETLASAKKKCPDLVIVPPRHSEYKKFSRIVNSIYLRYTDLVEPFGIDESWLDITGSMHLFGDKSYECAEKIANEIRNTVRTETGLTVSVGVSFNKIFAKLGSDYKKPDAVTVITEDNFKDIVFPLDVGSLLFAGRATGEKLHELRIKTVGELAGYDPALLEKKLGSAGRALYRHANGLDDSEVLSFYSKREVKSVGRGMTFTHDLGNISEVTAGISALSSEVCESLRKQNFECKTVQLSVKDVNLKTVQRRAPLEYPTNSTKKVTECALSIFEKCWNLRNPIRAMTVTAINLTSSFEAQAQLSFFDSEPNDEKEKKLDSTLDKINEKYGKNSIKPASFIKNDIGIK